MCGDWFQRTPIPKPRQYFELQLLWTSQQADAHSNSDSVAMEQFVYVSQEGQNDDEQRSSQSEEEERDYDMHRKQSEMVHSLEC